MTIEELQDILQTARTSVTAAGGKIDKNKPEVIALCDAYFFLFKKKVGVGSCSNCIFDAFFELKQLTSLKLEQMQKEKKFKLKRFPIYFGARHQHYTNVNITDEIAIEMVNFSKVNAANFENPEELIAAAASESTAAPAPVATSIPKAAKIIVIEKTATGIAKTVKVAPIAPAPVMKVEKVVAPMQKISDKKKKNKGKKK